MVKLGLSFTVKSQNFKVNDLCFKVNGQIFIVKSLYATVKGLIFRVNGLTFRVRSLKFYVKGIIFRVNDQIALYLKTFEINAIIDDRIFISVRDKS